MEFRRLASTCQLNSLQRGDAQKAVRNSAMPGFVVDCRVRLHYPAMAEIGQDPGPLSGPDATRQASPPELERVGGRGGTPVPAKAATDASRPPSWSAERTGCLPK